MGRMNLDTRPLNLSFPESKIEKMKAAAKRAGKSLSAYIGDIFDKAQTATPKRRAVRS